MHRMMTTPRARTFFACVLGAMLVFVFSATPTIAPG
jgi:hypothetical protein